jgi:MFS transporter, ACS family, D-galactonate transporter
LGRACARRARPSHFNIAQAATAEAPSVSESSQPVTVSDKVFPRQAAMAPIPNAAAPAQERSALRRWGVLGLLCLAFIAAYFDRVNLSVAVLEPDFKKFFDLSATERGLLHSAFFWSYCVLQIPAGWAVDRFGAKKSLAAAFVLWSVVSAATGLAQNFAFLFVLRFLLGVGEAAMNPAGMRWIRFNMPEEKRGLAIGIYQASAKIGAAAAPLIATYLMTLWGWRAMFIVMGLGCLVWLVPWMVLVRDDDRQIEAAQRKSSGGKSIPFGDVLKSPVIWGTVVGTFAYQYFLYFTMTWTPAYFTERRHLQLSDSSLYTAASLGGMAIVATLAGFAADRLIARGRNPVVVRKAFVIAGLLLASTQTIGAYAESLAVAQFFAIFSLSMLGLATANYWALTQTLIPGGSVGKIVGIQNCAAQIPGIVAPILTGWLVKKTGNYEAPMAVIGVVLLMGVAAYVFVVREKYAPRA